MEENESALPPFAGFAIPEANWYRTPDNWTDISADITNIAELKVVEYVLRHTWGFREYDIKKHITIDEFVHGRKKRDGSRMDRGTGLSERAVRYGLARAVQHGFIEEEVDRSDRARIKKSYSVRMKAGSEPAPDASEEPDTDVQAEVHNVHPEVQDVHPKVAEFAPRTETGTPDHPIEDTTSNRSSSMADASGGKTVPSITPSPTPRVGGFQALREVVAHLPRPGTTTSPLPHVARAEDPAGAEQAQPPPEYIDALIGDVSVQLGDRQHVRSNIAQARRLHDESGLSVAAFAARLHEAQSVTKAQPGVRKRMPYFFQVLTSLLGLDSDPGVEHRSLRSTLGP